ncbi:MAG: phosphatase PAP2 family protein [Actinobacteria bacterium]|uniref:Unannotated protein n=1 Tax=freshwater metagenome TaxID=449393 RepID=A0A6J6PU54_9ZZZZ|nr:phosphatase PAP2 family protein [Actinomycetota bacterium]
MSRLPDAPTSGAAALVSPVRPETRPRARLAAMAAYAVLLGAWSWWVGIPNDTVGVALWLWLATIAWDVDAPREHHLLFLRDWSKPIGLLIVYWLLRGLADEVGVPVHVRAPIRFDEWLAGLFGGTATPTEILQRSWCGVPCGYDVAPRWYDVVLTTTYASHFLVSLTLAAVLWVRHRPEWVRWMRRFVAINFAGLTIYWIYPMAPPWMASRDGYLGAVVRTTGRGWSEIDLHRQTMVLHGMGNKVAAMPSLHAGIAFLVAFYLITRLRSPARWLLLAYPVVMSTALVYYGEHYVVDALAGAVVALLVMLGCGAWERRHPASA